MDFPVLFHLYILLVEKYTDVIEILEKSERIVVYF